jgi:PAS domain S-box-containing protein
MAESFQPGPEFFQAAVEFSPHGVFLADGEGHYLYANDAACRITGYSREDLIGQHVLDLVTEDGREVGARHLAAVRDHGRAADEIPFSHRDGTVHWWLVDAFQVGDDRYVGVVRDVTERRRVAGELEQERARFARAQAVARVGWWEFDLGEESVMASPVAREVYGLPADGPLTIAQVQAQVMPDDRGRLDGAMRRLVTAGEPYDVEFRIRRANDGAVCNVRSLAEFDADRRRVFGVLQDVTRVERAEEALRRREAQLRAIFDSASDYIFLKDRQLRYTHANPACLQFLGLAEHEVLGRTDDEIFDGELATRIARTDRAVLEGRADREVVVRRMADRSAVLETVKVPVRDGQGEVVGICGIARDITAKRQLEAQLRQAQKMEAVGRLAGGIAHDFNNLLTPILGFAGLLADSFGDEDPRRGDLAAIVRAAERARDLTAQLLAFGRKQLLEMRTLDLNATIRESESMLRRLVRENIELDLRLAEDLWAVRADLSQLNNILINLVVNGADAMPKGGTLTIRTANAVVGPEHAERLAGATQGPHAVLEVRDEGSGMDPDTMAMIFEPFFTTKGQGQGTGLGLATVHGIVKQHGGVIDVGSKPGEGSCFRVFLPRSTDALDHPHESQPATELAGDERILIVEDDDAVRSLAAAVLGKYGYTVESAARPEDAIALATAAEHPFDLLLTDVVMPGMNGPQLHRALEATFPDLPVVFMSGYTTDVIAHHGVLEDHAALLTKPFTPQGLAARVREVLLETRARGSSR